MINIQLINIMLPIKQDLLRTFDHLRLMRKSVTLAKCNWEWSSSGITLKWLFSLNKRIFETFVIQRRGADKSPLLRKRDSVQFNWLPMTRPWLFLNGVDCILIMTNFVVDKINMIRPWRWRQFWSTTKDQYGMLVMTENTLGRGWTLLLAMVVIEINFCWRQNKLCPAC